MTGFKNSRKKGEGEQSITLTCNCHLHMLKAQPRPFFLLGLLGFLTLVPSPKGMKLLCLLSSPVLFPS